MLGSLSIVLLGSIHCCAWLFIHCFAWLFIHCFAWLFIHCFAWLFIHCLLGSLSIVLLNSLSIVLVGCLSIVLLWLAVYPLFCVGWQVEFAVVPHNSAPFPRHGRRPRHLQRRRGAQEGRLGQFGSGSGAPAAAGDAAPLPPLGALLVLHRQSTQTQGKKKLCYPSLSCISFLFPFIILHFLLISFHYFAFPSYFLSLFCISFLFSFIILHFLLISFHYFAFPSYFLSLFCISFLFPFIILHFLLILTLQCSCYSKKKRYEGIQKVLRQILKKETLNMVSK